MSTFQFPHRKKENNQDTTSLENIDSSKMNEKSMNNTTFKKRKLYNETDWLNTLAEMGHF